MVYSILNQSANPKDYNLFRPEKYKIKVETVGLKIVNHETIRIEFNKELENLESNTKTSWFKNHQNSESIICFLKKTKEDIEKWDDKTKSSKASDNNIEELEKLIIQIKLINRNLKEIIPTQSDCSPSVQQHVEEAEKIRIEKNSAASSPSGEKIQVLIKKYDQLLEKAIKNASVLKDKDAKHTKEVFEIHKKIISDFSSLNDEISESEKKCLEDYLEYFKYFEDSIESDSQLSRINDRFKNTYYAQKTDQVIFPSPITFQQVVEMRKKPLEKKYVYSSGSLINIRANTLINSYTYTPEVLLEALRNNDSEIFRINPKILGFSSNTAASSSSHIKLEQELSQSVSSGSSELLDRCSSPSQVLDEDDDFEHVRIFNTQFKSPQPIKGRTAVSWLGGFFSLGEVAREKSDSSNVSGVIDVNVSPIDRPHNSLVSCAEQNVEKGEGFNNKVIYPTYSESRESDFASSELKKSWSESELNRRKQKDTELSR